MHPAPIDVQDLDSNLKIKNEASPGRRVSINLPPIWKKSGSFPDPNTLHPL